MDKHILFFPSHLANHKTLLCRRQLSKDSPENMRSDAELVKAIVGGNVEAFGDLVRRHERAARAVAAATLRDHHAAEDVAQEAFVTAYSKLDSLRNPAAFGSWLLRIARHKALREARRSSRAAPLQEADRGELPSDDGHSGENHQRLLDAVMRLPRSQRQVVMLRYFDERSVREVAEVTGRPLGTVTKKLSRACRRLRASLEVRDDER